MFVFANKTKISLVSLPDAKLLTSFDNRQTLLDLALSPTGKLLASGSDNGQILVRDFQSGEILHHWQDDGAITSLRFSPDSSLLVATINNDATSEAYGQVYSLDSNKLYMTLQNVARHWIYGYDFSADSRFSSSRNSG